VIKQHNSKIRQFLALDLNLKLRLNNTKKNGRVLEKIMKLKKSSAGAVMAKLQMPFISLQGGESL